MKKIFTLLFLFLMVGSASAQDKWFNFLRKGTLSDDPVSSNFTNFTGRFGNTNKDEKGVVVDDPVDGQPALTLTSIAFNYQELVVDEEGQPVLGPDDQPTYRNYYKKDDGTMVDQIQDWDTQFHVSIPHKFTGGQKFKLKFHARADKPVSIYAQAQTLPGNYLDNLWFNIDLTDEWKEFVYDGGGDGVDAIDGMQTVSFNCNTNKSEVITFYFRFDEFSCDIADASEDERTLKRESLKYPVPAINQETSFKLDMTPMMETLGIEDLAAFLNDNTMKLRMMTTVDGKNVVGYSGAVQPTTGALIDGNGSMVDEEKGISLYFPEEGVSGNEATLTFFNVDLNLAKGNSVRSRILFEKQNWNYAYDLMLLTQEDYDNPDSGGSGVLYSWESPDGTPVETGGKATFEGGDEGENRVNYKNTAQGVDYYTLSLNGKKANIDDEGYEKNCTPRVIITLDEMLYGGEEIQVTAYTNKNDVSKRSTPFFKFENGTTLLDDTKDFIDLGIAGNTEPVTNTYEVPAEAMGSKWFKMSRSQTATNLFITKLVIVGNAATGVTEVKQVKVDNGIVYNLAGHRVDASYKGLVIKNGQLFIQQ